MCMCQKHGEKGENLRMKGQYTKLFLIGNGFDRWQGLPTSYGDFRQYYFAHILEITKELRIKTEVDDAGRLITPVAIFSIQKHYLVSSSGILNLQWRC